MKAMRGVGIIVLGMLIALAGRAQTYEGRILGTVTDQQGKVIVGAQVVITNVDTGLSRSLVTNQVGDFVAPNLPPGQYLISAEAPGFKKVERSQVRLEVARDVRADLVLVPGSITQVVQVSAEAPLIDTTNDAIGGALSNKAINDLPLNGRDYQNLVVLRPGVVRFPGGGFESIAANGMRPEDNDFIIEGVDDNDPYYSGNIINAEGVQGTPGSILPIDAIQEFNTEENPTADYGWKPGVTVNIGLKSGTNSFHGSTYYFARNNAFDARNFFNAKPSPQVALHQHQFGGSIGGPIIHDKTFFFVDYEGVRGFIANAATIFTPATVSLAPSNNPTTNCQFIPAGDCANSLPDAIMDVEAGQMANGLPVMLNPETANLIGMGTFGGNGAFPGVFPVNPGTNPMGSTTLNSGFPNVNRSETGVVKIDHRFTDTQVISARYLIGDSTQTEQDFIVLRPQWLSQSNLRAQVFGINYTWTPRGNWVNEFRFGFNHFYQSILAADHAKNPLTTYGINTGVLDPLNFGMPEIDIGGFTSLGNVSGWPLETIPNKTIQFVDNASYTRGSHTLRFGGEVRRGSTDNIRNRTGKGRIEFFGGATPFFPNASSTALEDFVAGFPGLGKIFVGNSERKVHMYSFAAFLEDDWRMTPRFTLNLGLRWEFNTPIKEAHDRLANFDPRFGLEQVGLNVSSPYNSDRDNFAPRIGLAWDPWGRGKTVVRAGAGLIYEIPHISLFIGQNGVDNATTTGLNTIPTGAIGGIGGNIVATGLTLAPCTPPSTASCVNYTGASDAVPIFSIANTQLNCDPNQGGTPCDILGVKRRLETPFSFQWNLNVQQSLTNTTALQVAYVGNRGLNLYSVRDINQTSAQVALTCAPFDSVCEQSGRPFNAQFPSLEFINFLENLYTSSYHSLQVTATQRVWHGLNFLAGYTWSHSIDNATNNRAVQPQDSTHPELERASSDFDVRQRLTLALTYQIPGIKSWAHLLEGWQMNNIVTIQGGTPWTVLDGVLVGDDISATGEFADRWNIFGNPAKIHASPDGPIPFFGPTSFGTDMNGNPIGNPDCLAHAMLTQLETYGCFEQGGTVIVPPNPGTFGKLGRNAFRGPRLDNWDFSLVKNTKLGERVTMQLRGEFFNVLNHPHFANPEAVTLLNLDPSVPSSFGFESVTPDVGAANPVIGTGGPRNIQIGIKFLF